MTRVYVTEPGSRVTVRDGQVMVLKDEAVKGHWPLDQVKAVHCFGPMHLTGHGMQRFLDSGVEVHLYTVGGRYRGSITSGEGERLFIQMAHFDRWRDAGFRLELARALVRHKVQGQAAVLAERAHRGADALLRSTGEGLKEALVRIEAAGELGAVMGHEGYAARLYFQAFGAWLKEGIPFEGRNRQPPRDPVNALLSLGYTLVGTELTGQLEASGLSPRLGFLHGFRYGRASLAQDLLEELRAPCVDRWVVGLFNTGRVRLEHFEQREDGGVYLTAPAFKAVLQLYSRWMGPWDGVQSWRSRLAMRVQALVDVVVDGGRLAAPAWGKKVHDALSGEL